MYGLYEYQYCLIKQSTIELTVKYMTTVRDALTVQLECFDHSVNQNLVSYDDPVAVLILSI